MKMNKLLTLALCSLSANLALAQSDSSWCSLEGQIDPQLTLVDAIDGYDESNAVHRMMGIQRFETDSVSIDLNPLNLYFNAKERRVDFSQNDLSCFAETDTKNHGFKVLGTHQIRKVVLKNDLMFTSVVENQDVSFTCYVKSLRENDGSKPLNFLKVVELPNELRKVFKVPCENLKVKSLGGN